MANKQNDQISAPSSSGGLMRFNEEYPSKLQVKPEWVVIAIAVVVISIAILKLTFKIV